MHLFTESQLEQSIIQLFVAEGYIYVPGDHIQRKPGEVVLHDDLSQYLLARYAGEDITPDEVDRAIRRIVQSHGGSVYEENRQFMQLMMEGFSLKREDPTKPNLYIYPISFDSKHQSANIFKIVNQFEIEGADQKRIPDGVLFVNGLPLVVLEFKSAVKESTTILDAYKQVTVRYVRDIPQLFRYNAFVVISDGVNNRYGSVFASYEFFTSWRKIEPQEKPIDGIPTLQTMVRGLFNQGRLLEVLHDFIFIPDSSKNDIKVVCRYPQFYGAKALYKNILLHSHLNGGDGKGGTYFGATGCGKSFTMLFLTRLLMRSKALCSPTILLITDRTDLDDQLSRQVLMAKQYIGDEMLMQVESRAHLKELLKGRSSGGVFLTTIQKFSKDIDLLSKRQNIICISDEAHRSQLSLEQKIEIGEDGVTRKYGFAHYLHESLPNATYVGFTGTPIDATIEVFGPVVDEYTMIDAVNDEVTRAIIYEGRAAKVIVDSQKVKEIEDYYNKCADEGASEYQIAESKKAMTQMEVLLSNPDIISRIAVDFIQHYERRIEEGSTVEGKAMIVCASRGIAYQLYKEILHHRPQWGEVMQSADGAVLTQEEKEKIKPIERMKMVFIRDKDDEKALWDLLGSDEERKTLDLQFKEPKSNFKIALVVDMWITGFDVPCLDTMYCYKPLQLHSLIQTVSRVNRNYPGKDKGLVVDYLGIKRNLNAAMRKYANGGMDQTPVEAVEQAVKLFKDELSVLHSYFHGFDYSPFATGTPLEQLDTLNQGAELMIATKDQEKNFMKHALIAKQTFGVCQNHDDVTVQDVERLHFFSAVRSVIYKMTKGDAPDAAQMNKRVLELVNNALVSDEVEVICNMGLGNAEQIDVLAHQYLDKVNKIPLKNTKVRLMERLLKQVINSIKQINRIRAIDFSDRLAAIVEKYNDRSDDLVMAEEVIQQVTQQLAELLDDIVKDSNLPEGVPDIEVKAFYDILKKVAEQHNFAEKFTEEQFADMANCVKAIVDDKSKFVDCFKRDDIRAAMQVDIIIELSKHGFPPVSHNDIYKAIMEQAENFKKNVGAKSHMAVGYPWMDEETGTSLAAEPAAPYNHHS